MSSHSRFFSSKADQSSEYFSTGLKKFNLLRFFIGCLIKLCPLLYHVTYFFMTSLQHFHHILCSLCDVSVFYISFLPLSLLPLYIGKLTDDISSSNQTKIM